MGNIDINAISLLKDFIKEELGGNIKNLRGFDFSTLKEDRKYGGNFIERTPIVKAIMSLAFADVWDNLSFDSITRGRFECDIINKYQNLFGINMCDQYFKGLREFNPTNAQHQRALKIAHMSYSVGNFWILPCMPSVASRVLDYRYRYYMDKFLQSIYNIMTQGKRVDKTLQDILAKNKLLDKYQGEEGFGRFVKDMILDDFVDYYGKPEDIFMFVWSAMKDLDRETYFKAVDQYCTFCESFIPKRADRIIAKLEQILNNTQKTDVDKTSNKLTKYDFEYKIVTECFEFAMKGKMGILTDKNYFMTLCAKMKLQPEGFSWDDFIIETKKLEDDFVVIIYQYPKPTKEPEAMYGAILVDNYWGRVTYYTLEMCNHKGRWALGINESGGHSLVGLYDIEPTIQNFLKLIVPPTQTIPDVNIKVLLGLPSNYQELKNIPKEVDGCVSYGTATPSCKALIQVYMITHRKAMPFDDVKVLIVGIHESLSDDQALIEVKAGKTNNGRKYVLSIVKIKQESHGVRYFLQMDVEYEGAALSIKGHFIEIGMTGYRDTMIWELACRKGIVSSTDNSRWCFDPYDKTLKRPYLMNLSEKEEYDEMFPDHPLSQCRRFIQILIQKL